MAISPRTRGYADRLVLAALSYRQGRNGHWPTEHTISESCRRWFGLTRATVKRSLERMRKRGDVRRRGQFQFMVNRVAWHRAWKAGCIFRIPSSAIRDDRLGDLDLALVSLIRSRTSPSREETWADSHGYLAGLIGASRQRVCESVAKLQALGILSLDGEVPVRNGHRIAALRCVVGTPSHVVGTQASTLPCLQGRVSPTPLLTSDPNGQGIPSRVDTPEAETEPDPQTFPGTVPEAERSPAPIPFEQETLSDLERRSAAATCWPLRMQLLAEMVPEVYRSTDATRVRDMDKVLLAMGFNVSTEATAVAKRRSRLRQERQKEAERLVARGFSPIELLAWIWTAITRPGCKTTPTNLGSYFRGAILRPSSSTTATTRSGNPVSKASDLGALIYSDARNRKGRRAEAEVWPWPEHLVPELTAAERERMERIGVRIKATSQTFNPSMPEHRTAHVAAQLEDVREADAGDDRERALFAMQVRVALENNDDRSVFNLVQRRLDNRTEQEVAEEIGIGVLALQQILAREKRRRQRDLPAFLRQGRSA